MIFLCQENQLTERLWPFKAISNAILLYSFHIPGVLHKTPLSLPLNKKKPETNRATDNHVGHFRFLQEVVDFGCLCEESSSSLM